MRIILIALLILSIVFTPAHAAQYACQVSKKSDALQEYRTKDILDAQFSVKINEKPELTIISRCSFSPSESKVTCDEYEADKIVYDEHVKIKKYYFFHSQFDVQLFSNMDFIENNGRGGIAFGTCKVVSQ